MFFALQGRRDAAIELSISISIVCHFSTREVTRAIFLCGWLDVSFFVVVAVAVSNAQLFLWYAG